MNNKKKISKKAAAPVLAKDAEKPAFAETREALRLKETLTKKLTAQPEADPDVWKQARDWLAKGMIGESVIGGSDPNSYKHIQEFQASNRNPPGNFRYWHVEDLLDQIAGLLDRAIANRAEWREKLSKTFYVESEIREYIETDKIYSNEVRDGLYEVPFVEADQERLAQEKFLYHNYSTPSVESMQQVIYFDFYNSWNQGTNQIGEWRWKVEEKSAGVRYAEIIAINRAALLRLDSAKKRSQWEGVNRLYKKQRAEAARKTAEQKIAAFTTPGGALNYPGQMCKLQDLIARDAGDAFSRMKVAAVGLQKIFGYAEPFSPSLTKAINSGSTDHNTLDDAALWTRDAISWLVGFKQLDQNFVQPISLRSLITVKQWEDGRDAGTWKITLNANPWFGSFSHVRMRGARAFVYGCGIEAGFWRIELTPPEQAEIRHQDKSRTLRLDQTLLPNITIPRVGSRSNGQEVEFVGSTALFNTSPIGEWKITITSQSTQRIPVNVIDDLELEIVIAARSS